MTFHSFPFDYPIGAVFLAFLPVVILFCPWRKVGFPALAFVLFGALWFIGSHQTRYAYFPIALFFVLAAGAWEEAADAVRGARGVISALLGLAIVVSFAQTRGQYSPGLKRLVSGESNASYLRRYVRHADSLEMVRANTPKDAKVLLLDGYPEYLFYFPRTFVQGGAGVLTTTYWDAALQSTREFTSKLNDDGITHLCADKSTAGLDRYLAAAHWTLLAEDSSYALYQREPV